MRPCRADGIRQGIHRARHSALRLLTQRRRLPADLLRAELIGIVAGNQSRVVGDLRIAREPRHFGQRFPLRLAHGDHLHGGLAQRLAVQRQLHCGVVHLCAGRGPHKARARILQLTLLHRVQSLAHERPGIFRRRLQRRVRAPQRERLSITAVRQEEDLPFRRIVFDDFENLARLPMAKHRILEMQRLIAAQPHLVLRCKLGEQHRTPSAEGCTHHAHEEQGGTFHPTGCAGATGGGASAATLARRRRSLNRMMTT